ncbi:phage tail tape measure protein [Actibacterium sp. MT2.3-13A]|uniref:phage tail tape measure protein n=1 Tax=Actibacterium sp. MT2.3-13A TaxID=2828332 RepID=UPI002013BDC6|nr:phage tail tape measure protein [Actibacterium sp. MT2.3-13A]
MTEIDGLDALEAQIDALEDSFGGARGMAAAFDLELVRMRDSLTLTGREVGVLSRSIGRGLRAAFDGLVFDGIKLSEAMRGLADSILNAAYSAAVTPVQNHLGGLIASGIEGLVKGAVPFAGGGAFTQGRVMPFASGGVVRQASYFPMRGGIGLMGEAGPEAIMPLTRVADGRLGVRAQGGGRPVNVTLNISTPDVQGFRRSQSQIAAELGRMLSRGQRNN